MKLWGVANPLQDLETVLAGHLEVEEHQIRERVLHTVAERPFALEVRYGFFSIPDELKAARYFCLGKRFANEDNIVVVVFSYEDYRSSHTKGMVGWQTVLPLRRGVNTYPPGVLAP